jgi:carbon storage regulator CsrA
MLVLSRRMGQKIIFPSINLTVRVVALKSGAVRLGIEAPPEVTVLREELSASDETQEAGASLLPDGAAEPTLYQLNRLYRNWLDVAAIGLALFRRQIQAELTEITLDITLDPFDEEIGALRRQMQRMGRQPLPKSKVLLVEDDQHGCEALARLLNLAGFCVATACDGSKALDYLGAQSLPDVLLLDMRLPSPCDSPTLVRTIRHDPVYAGLKIFGVTSHGLEQFGLASGSSGIDHWFKSPFTTEGLLDDLNQQLADVV